jgi:hypothetical protein
MIKNIYNETNIVLSDGSLQSPSISFQPNGSLGFYKYDNQTIGSTGEFYHFPTVIYR